MHNDLWQSYHPNGAPKQGEGLARKDLTKDTIVAAAHVWLWRRSSDGGCDILLQRRADQVKNWPGYWDISAAGHVSLGETPLDAALREAQEEIGMTLDTSRVKFIGSLPKRKSAYSEFHFIYTYEYNDEPLDMVDGEAAALRWVPYDTFRQMIEQPEDVMLVPHRPLYFALLMEELGRISRES